MLQNIDTKVRITLQAPYTNKAGRFFSVHLKRELNNEPAKYSLPRRTLVISGLEGDFRTLCKILSKCRVINKYLQWTFGEGHLVILGNCFDKDERLVEYLWFVYSLEEKARKSGGYVHFILGKNEILNLNGGWRHEHPRYAKGDVSSGIAATALYDANNEIWRWLQTKNIVEKIGSYLFVHGGIAHAVLQLNLSVTRLNRLVRGHYSDVGIEIPEDPALHMLFNSEQSPVWYKGYFQQDVSEQQMNDILQFYKVKAIITGCATVGQITAFCNGKVVNVATDQQNEKAEALLILGHRFYRVDGSGERERIKR